MTLTVKHQRVRDNILLTIVQTVCTIWKEGSMLITSNEYLQAVQEINDYVNQAKYRASVSVNSEVLKTNLFIGSVIIRNSEWGNKFVEFI